MAYMKRPRRLSASKLDSLINTLYVRHCSGVEIDMMDIGKIFKVGVEAYDKAWMADPSVPTLHEDAVRQAIVTFVQSIRKN